MTCCSFLDMCDVPVTRYVKYSDVIDMARRMTSASTIILTSIECA